MASDKKSMSGSIHDHTLWLSDELFNLFRTNASAYAEEGYPNCDPLMIPVLKVLNQYEGIATVNCCESHPETGKPEDRRTDIMMAVSEEGFPTLMRLYRQIADALRMAYGAQAMMRFRLRFVMKHHSVLRSLVTPYSAAELVMAIRTDVEKDYFFKVLYHELNICEGDV